MDTTITNKIEHYKSIEALCTANHILWQTCPNFRGAFSKFAMRVSQLEIIANGEGFMKQFVDYSSERIHLLLKEIDVILKNHFDRYFAYLNQRNLPVFAHYSALRQQSFT